MATKKSVKKNTRKRGRRYLKKTVRRTIAALLMVTALIVAAIPATPSRAASIPGSMNDYTYVYFDISNRVCLYFDSAGSGNQVLFKGFDSIEVGRPTASSIDIYENYFSAKAINPADSGVTIRIPEGEFYAYTKIGDPDHLIDIDEDHEQYESSENEATKVECVQIGQFDSGSSSDIVNFEKIGILDCPSSVKVIKANVFREEGEKKPVLTTIKASNIENVGSYAFYGCSHLGETSETGEGLRLGSKIKEIGAHAFQNCTQLQNIPVVSNGTLDKMGESAFEGCTGLNNDLIIPPPSPEAIAEMGPGDPLPIAKRVFYGCSSLKNVKIDDNYTKIGSQAFAGCTSLEQITLPSHLTSVDPPVTEESEEYKGVLSGTNLKTIHIPGGIQNMPENFLTDCTKLASVYLNNRGGNDNTRDIVFDSTKQYFPTSMEEGVTLTVYGFHDVLNSLGEVDGRTSAYLYCLKKRINYSSDSTKRYDDDSEFYDGGSADDYFGVDSNGRLTDCELDLYLDNMYIGSETKKVVIPDRVDNIQIKKIASDLFTNSRNGNDRLGDVQEIEVGCLYDGCEVEPGAFYMSKDSTSGGSTTLKYVDFYACNNIHLDSSDDPQIKMFPTNTNFYVKANLDLDPSKVIYDRNNWGSVGHMNQVDDNNLISNAYVFAMNNGYKVRGESTEGHNHELYVDDNYTLYSVDGHTQTDIPETEIELPSGVLFINGSTENKSDDSSVFYSSPITSFSAKGLLELRSYQFAHCPKLDSVSIPDTLQNFGLLPFVGCTTLNNDGLTINTDATKEYAFKKDDQFGVIVGPYTSSQGDKYQYGMIYEALENNDEGDETLPSGKNTPYTVPSTVHAIKEQAFQNNNWVYTFDTRNNGSNTYVKTIPENCFYNANKITQIILGKGTGKVDKGAFNYGTDAPAQDRPLTIKNSSGLGTEYEPNLGWIKFSTSWNVKGDKDRRHQLYGFVPSTVTEDQGYDEDSLYREYLKDKVHLNYAGSSTSKSLLDDAATVEVLNNGDVYYDDGGKADVIQNTNYVVKYYNTSRGIDEDLIKDKEYSITFDSSSQDLLNNPVDGAKVYATIAGEGEYNKDDKIGLTFTLKSNSSVVKSISDCSISVNPEVYYSGDTATFTQGVDYSITYENKDLELNKDYILSYEPVNVLNNPEDGKQVTVKFNGIDGYKGTVTESFTLKYRPPSSSSSTVPPSSSSSSVPPSPPTPDPGKLAGATIMMSGEIEYTGNKIDLKPVKSDTELNEDFQFLVIADDGTVLQFPTDFTYDPMSVKNEGDYVLTITGKGNYSPGILTKSFTVKAQGSSSSSSSTSSSSTSTPASSLSVNLILNGPDRSAVSKETYKATNNFQYWNEGDPGIKSIVDRNGNALSEGTDYTIQSYGTVRPGIGKNTGYVQIQFKGNYSSEGRQNFYYDVKKDLSKNTSDDGVKSVTIQVSEATIDSSDKIEATVALTDSTTGTDLAKDTDYLQGSYKKTSDHHADVKVTGKGDKYVGTYTYNFRMEEKKSSSSSGKSSSSSSKGSSSSAKSSSSSSGTGGSSSSGGGSGGSGNNNSGTTVVNRNYYNSGNGGSVDELQDMLKAAHIDSINGGTADGYQVNITKSDAAEAAFREALLRRYGSLDNIRYFSMDIDVKDENGNDIDTTGMSVTLTLPLPGSMEAYGTNNKVATVDGNGDLEDLNVQFSTLEGRPCATFVAPHFSPYGFYVNTGDLAIGTLDNTPKTADPISPKWFISLGLAALSIFLFLKKDPKPRANAA